MSAADDKLTLAKRHLERVQAAWYDPTDWADLSIYGFYALEAAVDAACLHTEIDSARHYAARASAAAALASSHGLPDVSELLRDLNEGRKHQSYGDVDPPELSAEETAAAIEAYVDSVAALGGTAMKTKPMDSVIVRWPTERAKAWLASFVERSQRDENVVAIVAIGSAVRPGVASDDLDLLVLCRDRSALKHRAPIEVDVRKANAEGIESDIRGGDVLAAWAVLFGRTLLDKERVWEGVVRRWRDDVPLPDVDVSLARAKAIRERMKEMREIGDDNALCDLNLSYLTHLAWARLAKAGVFPRSRPEIPSQLEEIGEGDLAAELTKALAERCA